MTALLPRLFGDVGDLLDMQFVPRPHLIRVEDTVTDEQYVLRAEVPGLDPDKDIQVTYADGMLLIRAERKEEEKTATRSEFRYGALRRAVRLPDNADGEKITARYDKGILEVSVPLTTAPTTARRITVESTA